MTPSEDWIETAYIQAELSAATTSVKEILRMEKCGCGSCIGWIKKEYESWARWGKFSPDTRQNISKVRREKK